MRTSKDTGFGKSMFVELEKSDWQSEIIPELHECAALKAPEVQLEMNG